MLHYTKKRSENFALFYTTFESLYRMNIFSLIHSCYRGIFNCHFKICQSRKICSSHKHQQHQHIHIGPNGMVRLLDKFCTDIPIFELLLFWRSSTQAPLSLIGAPKPGLRKPWSIVETCCAAHPK